ncbi:MAG: fused DSP-PTPase phosphatase/NAD kinase-like protein [Gemmatimonadaceae bacterium]
MMFVIARLVGAVGIMSVVATGVCAAQHLTGQHPTPEVPSPVALDNPGLFQEKFSSVGDDFFISGQPTEQGLRDLRARGVTTVINLRSPPEMAKVPFDEAKLVKELGMNYVYLPMRGTPELPYSPARVKEFADAMSNAQGKVLLHCTIAWRASHLWAAYLIQYRNVPVGTALSQARMINLMDDMRMDGDRQPVESFLGRAVPEVGHPKG